jgi:hypothetical protein
MAISTQRCSIIHWKTLHLYRLRPISPLQAGSCCPADMGLSSRTSQSLRSLAWQQPELYVGQVANTGVFQYNRIARR